VATGKSVNNARFLRSAANLITNTRREGRITGRKRFWIGLHIGIPGVRVRMHSQRMIKDHISVSGCGATPRFGDYAELWCPGVA